MGCNNTARQCTEETWVATTLHGGDMGCNNTARRRHELQGRHWKSSWMSQKCKNWCAFTQVDRIGNERIRAKGTAKVGGKHVEMEYCRQMMCATTRRFFRKDCDQWEMPKRRWLDRGGSVHKPWLPSSLRQKSLAILASGQISILGK